MVQLQNAILESASPLLLLALIVLGWASRETDPEMEACPQEASWEVSSEPHLLGSKGSRIVQKDGLNCDAVTIKASANPTGAHAWGHPPYPTWRDITWELSLRRSPDIELDAVLTWGQPLESTSAEICLTTALPPAGGMSILVLKKESGVHITASPAEGIIRCFSEMKSYFPLLHILHLIKNIHLEAGLKTFIVLIPGQTR